MPSKRKVKCIETGIIYDSIIEAAKDNGLKDSSGIRACCKDLYETSGGYHWEYVEESDLPGEIWKYARCLVNGVILKFDNKYKCSNMGRLKRSDNNTLLPGSYDDQGYHLFKINNMRYKAHRIVATTFIPNDDPKNKIEVNHKDENKDNNTVSNLEWVTPKENANHGTRTERSAKGHYKKVRCIETGIVYESVKSAANAIKLKCGSGISTACSNSSRTAGGYHWEYVSEEDA